MKEIEFENLKNEIAILLKKANVIVVSTSLKDHVTSRTVNCFSDGLNLYFVTSKAYTKYKQLLKNHSIAVCKDNLQLEGVAEIKGHPNNNNIVIDDEEAKKYIDQYSKYKNAVLIKIVPHKITLYKGNGLFEYLNINDKKAFQKGKKYR